jgi:hypothetical protein
MPKSVLSPAALCEDRGVGRPPEAKAIDAPDDNWHGGYYELSMKLGAHDVARLDAALKTLWEVAGLPGAFRRPARAVL